MLPFFIIVWDFIFTLLAIIEPLIITLSSIVTLSIIKEHSIKQLAPIEHPRPILKDKSK